MVTFEPSGYLVAVETREIMLSKMIKRLHIYLVSCVQTIVLQPKPHCVPTLGNQQKENHMDFHQNKRDLN